MMMMTIFEIIAGMITAIIALIGAAAGVFVCWILIWMYGRKDEKDD